MVRIDLETVDSTQAVAARRAAAGAPVGTTVVARRQTEGRGRLDHRWASPPGGAYISVIAALPSRRASLYPLGVAVELARRIEGGTTVEVGLKWPNDLLAMAHGVRNGKLGGILVDRLSDGPADRAIVGVGINVTTDRAALPLELRSGAAILSELSERTVEIGEVTSMVVDSVHAATARLESPDGPGGVLAEYRSRLYGLGLPVSVDGRPVGILRSVEDDGSATVERDGEFAHVIAGDLLVGGPA